jgi:hypothetical protein
MKSEDDLARRSKNGMDAETQEERVSRELLCHDRHGVARVPQTFDRHVSGH